VRPDLVDVAVPVDPRDDLRVGEEERDHLVAEHARPGVVPGRPPVARSGFVIVPELWWLLTIVSWSCEAAQRGLQPANWVASSEPSAYPLGFTVSSTTKRMPPFTKE
jgi:hypothetical protein